MLTLTTAPATAGQGGGDSAPQFERHAVDHAKTGRVADFSGRQRAESPKERENASFQPAGQASTPAADPAQQVAASAATTTASITVTAEGLGVGDNVFKVNSAPPDTNGAAGGGQYVQSVNSQFAVYRSDGTKQKGPFFGSDLFKTLTGPGAACGQHDDGDPVVQYDKLANRWILTQFQVTVQPFLECVAVSTTPDATSAYNAYAYDYGADFVDYPKLGVWTNSYVVTYNVFRGNTFTGGEVCALNSAALVAGDAAKAAVQKCFRTSTSYAGLLPSDIDGPRPPASRDAYVVDMTAGKLNGWRLHVDWDGVTPTTFSAAPTAVTGVAAFTAACSGGGTCIPQKGTTQKLDSLADRLMYRLAFRENSGKPSLVVSHAVTVGATSRKVAGTTAVRWYELNADTVNAALTVRQQGTYAPDATAHRWLSSAAMNRNGAIVVGYSASDANSYPSIRVAMRSATDPAGTLGPEQVVTAGTGSQSGSNLSRWGDYASMSLDPDDCSMWFTTEYLTATGAFNWSTRILRVTPPGC